MNDRIKFLQNQGFAWNSKLQIYEIPNGGPVVTAEQVDMMHTIPFEAFVKKLLKLWQKRTLRNYPIRS